MTLRRLALTLALLSTPAQADDFDDLGRLDLRESPPQAATAAWVQGATRRLDDLLVRTDGTIAGVLSRGEPLGARIPWGLVRLVLADVDDDAGQDDGPTWFALTPSRRGLAQVSESGADGAIALNELAGAAVSGTGGAAVGVVRGALVSLSTGSIVALALDVGVYLGNESRIIAVPWSWMRISEDRSVSVLLQDEACERWIRSAPELEHGRLFA